MKKDKCMNKCMNDLLIREEKCMNDMNAPPMRKDE